MHEMLTLAFDDNATVEHRLLSGFLASNVGKLGGENCVLRLSLKLHRWKHGKSQQKWQETNELPFFRCWQVRPLVWTCQKIEGRNRTFTLKGHTRRQTLDLLLQARRVYYEACSHICKLYIHHKNYTIIRTVRYTTCRAWCWPPTSI